MDRKIIYPAQIPLVEDQLQAARFTQIGIGRISGALYGEGGTGASGFACTPVSGMIVSVAPGQIVSPGVVDTTSYGVLAADSSPLPIQYILPDATQLIVPSTAGTYIIYATPSVTDTTPAVLPFYNSATPTQVYAGPNNDGSSTDTIRSSQITLGIAATVPSGSVPLWSVTVASGVTAITVGMISVASGAPFYPSLAATAPRTVAPFNAALAAVMGGYPLNAIVADPSTAGKYWRSTADANMTTPGSDGAAWVDFFSGYATQEQVDTYYLRKDKAPTSGTFSNGYWTKTGNILIQSFVIPSAYDGLFAAFPIAYASGTKPVVVGISGSTPDEWTSWLTAGVYPNGESSVSNTGFTLAMPKQRASSAGLVTQDNPTSARVYIMGTV